MRWTRCSARRPAPAPPLSRWAPRRSSATTRTATAGGAAVRGSWTMRQRRVFATPPPSAPAPVSCLFSVCVWGVLFPTAWARGRTHPVGWPTVNFRTKDVASSPEPIKQTACRLRVDGQRYNSTLTGPINQARPPTSLRSQQVRCTYDRPQGDKRFYFLSRRTCARQGRQSTSARKRGGKNKPFFFFCLHSPSVPPPWTKVTPPLPGTTTAGGG